MNSALADGGQLLDRFAPLLEAYDREAMDRVGDMTCGVFAEGFVIGYVNAAWFDFGRANGASRVWGVGECLLDAITEPLRGYYAERFAHVLATGEPWERNYDCPSDATNRTFRLRVLPVGERQGLLMTHSLRHDGPHAEGIAFADRYHRAANGLITQCAHCRRLRRVTAPDRWDWVPAVVATEIPGITHGLCDACFAYYFGPGAFS